MTKAEIQLVRSLSDKKARQESGLFVAEGEKLVAELAASEFRVRKVFSTKDALPRRERSVPVAQFAGKSPVAPDQGVSTTGEVASGGDFEHISPREMERISHLKTPADCLALVDLPRWKFNPATLRDRLVIALDEVQNPGNLGTIIRLADWFGVSDILCSEGSADCFNPKVVQATMGSITRVKVHYGALSEIMEAVIAGPASGGKLVSAKNCTAESPGSADVSVTDTKTTAETAVYAETPTVNVSELQIFGTFLEGENIYTAALPRSGIVVFGNEGRGISPEIERLVTRRIHIPSFGASAENRCNGTESGNLAAHSESLNVAVAAAITVSEFKRR